MRSLLPMVVTSASLLTALSFVGGMVGFFRLRPGSARSRGVLTASILLGVAALLLGGYRSPAGGNGPVLAGLTLLFAAQLLFWWAVWVFGDRRPSAAFASAPPETLVVLGPYRWIRHPFYAAYVLALTAGALFVNAPWAWAVPVWLGFLYRSAALQEERLILSSALGPVYRGYQRRVGRFLPRTWRPYSRLIN